MVSENVVLLVQAVVSTIGFITYTVIHPVGWPYATVAIAYIAADGVKGIAVHLSKKGASISSMNQQATNNQKPPG